jgi:hypothetical protein
LAFDRTALREELSLAVFLASAQGWSTVRTHIRDFQKRYSRAYAAHHEEYRRDVESIWSHLEESSAKLQALDLLNSVQQLGEAVGADLLQRYRGLVPKVRRCSVPTSGLGLEGEPQCPSCKLALGETPPAAEVQAFFMDLDRALEAKSRQLSLKLVDRIIRDQVDQRLDNFLRIVRASDLTALSNTLNDDLVGFIRTLLREH